jgi:DNA-binding transcriptional regulator GbsR (MarR family)
MNRRFLMHKNLASAQRSLIKNVEEILGIFDVSDRKPIIVSALACAEKPLSQADISDRTDLDRPTVISCLERLEENKVVSAVEVSGITTYELSTDLEKAVFRSIQSKMDAVRTTVERHAGECETLLESARREYDDYDTLMAKYLRERVGKIKVMTSVMAKRSALLRLLDPGEEEHDEIRRITIE